MIRIQKLYFSQNPLHFPPLLLIHGWTKLESFYLKSNTIVLPKCYVSSTFSHIKIIMLG